MKLAIISDTHERHRQITIPTDGVDVLIHCGDQTNKGSITAYADFTNWLAAIPIKNKIIIEGNHSLGMEYGDKRPVVLEMYRNAGATYLENSGIEIDGVKFWGSPATPEYFQWAWNYKRGEQIAKIWQQIPDDTNVLITHGVAHGLLDEAPRGVFQTERVGCEELRKVIDSGRLKNLKLMCGGHIHYASGTMVYNGIQVVNAAICTEEYKTTNPVRIIEI